MVRRIQSKSVIIIAALFGAAAPLASADTTLVNYNFDYDVLDSGPDTYQIFQHKNAKAEISTDYASGGYASAHLTDEADDGNFVEFQGYFPEQNSGLVHFQFKFFIANHNNLFNVALVGKERYKLSPMGINFWLIYQDGWLKHKSDSIPKKLFQPDLFEWYALDALLDIDKGTYSLRISREYGETAVLLENQPFATGTDKGHSLKEYSFVGDLEDIQPADFYIDDVLISTSRETTLPEFVAPGRRKYFIEIWNDYHKQLQAKLQCLPAINLEDFGIYHREYELLTSNNQLEILQQLTRSKPHIGKSDEWQQSPELSAIVYWLNACEALDKKQLAQAHKHITLALENKPDAYIFQLTSLIISASYNTDNSDLYSWAYNLLQLENDARSQIALAMIAFHGQQYSNENHKQNINTALDSLDQLHEEDFKKLQQQGIQAINNDYILSLKRYMPESWEAYLKFMRILEQQYYAYLWQGSYSEANALANSITVKLEAYGIHSGIWHERQADVALLNDDLNTALELYKQQPAASQSSLLKMADIYHMLNDLPNEKILRESIYRNFSLQ